MNFKRISKRALFKWELGTILLYIFILSLPIQIFDVYSIFWWISIGLLSGVALFFLAFYFPLLYLTTKYALNETSIVYNKGVFARRSHVMARDKIVFITITKTPLTPIFRTCSVHIKATGAQISIKSLDVSVAKKIVAMLSPNSDF